MEFNKLHNLDCIGGMNSLPAGSVDLAFADPPFNIGYDYDVYEDRMAADEYLKWSKQWASALIRTLKPDGSFWLAIGDDFAAELKLLFQKELKLTCRSWIIWYYTFGVNCSKKFSRSHTHLFYFVKDPKRYTFNAEDIRIPSARQLVYADSRADSRGRLPDDTWVLRPQDLPDGFNSLDDTWHFPRVCGTFKERAGWHGCQMPEQLLGRIIKLCSKPGDKVLDPFGGSGTTLAVAKKLNRQFIGFELSPNYAKQIQARLDLINVGDKLAGAEEPTVKAPPTNRGKAKLMTKAEPATPIVVRRTPDEVNRAIIEAFFAARDGYPVDRVIADPELNARFIDICARFGIPGEVPQWNHRLMNLRKAGHFRGLPRGRVTSFPFEESEFERYQFACEIAIQKYRVEGNPLDKVLCNPALARRFDETVLSMLPEEISPLKIRWYSLRLRKRASIYRREAKALSNPLALPRNYFNPFDMPISKIPDEPGVYSMRGLDQPLYVGGSLNLRERFKLQFSAPRFDFWGTPKNSIEVGYRSVNPDNSDIVMPNQSVWAGRLKTIGNLSKLVLAS